jgi:hypothetical protein
LIVKFINPTAVGYVGMSAQTTNLKDGIKPVRSQVGDAPAHPGSNRGASAGLGGRAPRVAIASLVPTISAIESARERLEIAYNMLKRVMAYVDDVKYARLESIRRKMIEAMSLINEIIDELPYEVEIKISNADNTPYEVIEA